MDIITGVLVFMAIVLVLSIAGGVFKNGCVFLDDED